MDKIIHKTSVLLGDNAAWNKCNEHIWIARTVLEKNNNNHLNFDKSLCLTLTLPFATLFFLQGSEQ